MEYGNLVCSAKMSGYYAIVDLDGIEDLPVFGEGIVDPMVLRCKFQTGSTDWNDWIGWTGMIHNNTKALTEG